MPKSEIKLSANEKAFLELLISDYPEFRFCLNQKRFSFRYAEPTYLKDSTKSITRTKNSAKPTIFIGPPQPFFALQTLHELGHAICGHKDYTTHVKRLKIESEAWQTAKTVLKKYYNKAKTLQENPKTTATGNKLMEILPKWDDNYMEDCLDSYRDWLHTKSKCKKCGQTRYQTKDGEYHCPFCDTFCSKK